MDQNQQIEIKLSDIKRFVKKHETKILVGTTVVATVAAVKYRAKLKPLKALENNDYLEITAAQLESLRQGGAGIYDVHGLEVVVQSVPALLGNALEAYRKTKV